MDSVQIEGKVIRKYEIIGTGQHDYDVYEPEAGHHTITTIDGKWYGLLHTRDIPAHLATMPISDERINAVQTYYNDLRDEEALYIREAKRRGL